MATATITTTANFIPEFWSKSVQEEAHIQEVILGRVDRSLEAEIQKGDIIHQGKIAEIAAANLTNMTGTITFSANTEGKTDLTINTLTYSAVKFDDAARIQSINSLFEKYTKELGRGIMEKVENTVGALFASYSQLAGTDQVAVTDSVVRDALKQLDEANVPNGSSDRTMFVTPATKFDLFGIERYVNMMNNSKIGGLDGDKGRGWLGDVYDVAVYETNNLTTRQMAVMHREALLFAMQQDVTVQMRQPHDEFAEVVRAFTMFGVIEARDTFGVYLKGN